MTELIEITVNDGNRMRYTVEAPHGKLRGAIFFSRGFVHDLEKEAAGVRSRHNGVMSRIEEALMRDYGFAIVSVATNSYGPDFRGTISLERYIEDNRRAIEQIKPDAMMAHSIGGYVLLQVALREKREGNHVPRIAVLNAPLAPGEAVETFKPAYTAHPELAARISLTMVNKQLCTAYDGSWRGWLHFISNMKGFSRQLGGINVQGYSTALVQQGLAAEPVDIEGGLKGVELLAIIGEKDHLVIREALSIGIARTQTPYEYEARLRRTGAHLETLVLPIGHNLMPGKIQRLMPWNQRHYDEIIARAMGAHFTH